VPSRTYLPSRIVAFRDRSGQLPIPDVRDFVFLFRQYLKFTSALGLLWLVRRELASRQCQVLECVVHDSIPASCRCGFCDTELGLKTIRQVINDLDLSLTKMSKIMLKDLVRPPIGPGSRRPLGPLHCYLFAKCGKHAKYFAASSFTCLKLLLAPGLGQCYLVLLEEETGERQGPKHAEPTFFGRGERQAWCPSALYGPPHSSTAPHFLLIAQSIASSERCQPQVGQRRIPLG
jgi:hypothetical protein